MRYLIITKENIVSAIFIIVAVAALIMLPVQRNRAVLVEAMLSRSLPIYNVATAEKKIALTFNAAWGADDIPQLIELLKAEKVTCTFFMVGNWADKYPDKAKMIADAGFEVANHSYSHPDMTDMSSEQISADITRAGDAIYKACGVKPLLFRAPSGGYNNTVIDTANSIGYTCVQWNVDSLDWKNLTPAEIVSRIVKNAKSGSIVLFHTDKQNTYDALPQIIAKLRAEGYSMVKVSDIIYKSGFEIDSQGTQRRKE